MTGKSSAKPALFDQGARDRILGDLDVNFLVEAAAGTGKTTVIAGRVTALVREGKADISEIAAVTFTRKAAAQLRTRIAKQIETEESREVDASRKERLRCARERIDSAFIGTIHSFCSRLLRERPVEAGVDPEFDEADESQTSRLGDAIWREFEERVRFSDQTLEELGRLGVELSHLKRAYELASRYPEVRLISRPIAPPDLSGARKEAESLLDVVVRELTPLGRGSVVDNFSAAVWRAWHFRRNGGLEEPARIAEFLEILATGRIAYTNWPDRKASARIRDRLEELKEGIFREGLEAWHAYRHHFLMELIGDAVETFRRRRREVGAPSFADLLIIARDMLRDDTDARRHFQQRFRRLLVDEFQDTDPIQAEVMLFLTSDDPGEPDWKKLTPRPGALFIVGDPKQSIYRFRRADIETYDTVKTIMEKTGGRIESLSTNFRSTRPVCDWINGAFSSLLAGRPPYQPDYVPLTAVKERGSPLDGVFSLEIDAGADEAANEDARRIATWIAAEIARGARAPRDFLILLPKTSRLHVYARQLEEAGVPCQVSGGKAFGDSEELSALVCFSRAVLNPDDAVSFTAFLRSSLCGVDDDALYRHRLGGGRFSRDVKCHEKTDPRIVRAGDQLKKAVEIIGQYPPAAALSQIVEMLKIFPAAFTDEVGRTRAGNIARALAAARGLSADGASFPEIVEEISNLLESSELEEMEIEPARENVVRVMNLHKAKGLEAPVVFLAGPGRRDSDPDAEFAIRRGESQPEGYFLVAKASPFSARHGTEIARPPEWAKLENEETKFLAAEQVRLFYVAATRAMNTLVVSRRASGENPFGPWQALGQFITAKLPDAEERVLAAAKRKAPDFKRELPAAKKQRHDNKAAIITTSFASMAPSKFGKEALFHSIAQAGKGAAWGRVVHRLLEARMKNANLEIGQYGENLLRQEERPIEELDELKTIVDAMENSDIWKRARRSEEYYVEVPFSIVLPANELPEQDAASGLPEALVTGAIDLVFREGIEWIVVDYKSDKVGRRREELIKQYRRQMEIYVRCWERLARAGRDCVSAGLYFVDIREFVEL